MTNGDVSEAYATRRTDDYVSTILALAPPLTNEQRTRLAELLRPVRQRGVHVSEAAS
jgi:hypothetical protein